MDGWMDGWTENVVKDTERMGNGRLVGVDAVSVGPPGRLDTYLTYTLHPKVETTMRAAAFKSYRLSKLEAQLEAQLATAAQISF